MAIQRAATARPRHNPKEAANVLHALNPSDPMEIIKAVRRGLPGSTIKSVAEEWQLSLSELYPLLHLKARTAQRLINSDRLDSDVSDRLVQVIKLHNKCLDVFQDRNKVLQWLKTPNYSLGDQTPLSLLDTSEGVELVHAVLIKIQYGIFA
ncbi:DUF2384 domain-containing protein [Geomonas sp. Red32]|uniref:type II RES/Xre toxin-antitoxin system antitoxin n=1 Tax=Geomonas sp. Red32 TaxID=2912856 RepID=UPI00202CA99E|nr:antitoxin Xre/MbcA/ParS toxin-binding domain-containing protein [Geomonas sp. Red32]MCM0082123.1 DUF2384 domain-containing protein [Geomonas sp. Red32]